MGNGNIGEVVLGFKQIVDGIPAFLDNFADGLDKLYAAFEEIAEEFIPLKYYAVCDYGYWNEVKIFDSEKQRDKWILNACKSDEFSENKYEKLPAERFKNVAQNCWNNLKNYSFDDDGVLIFCLR